VFGVWEINCFAGISVVIAVGIALVIIVYATLFVVCILFIRKYDDRFNLTAVFFTHFRGFRAAIYTVCHVHANLILGGIAGCYITDAGFCDGCYRSAVCMSVCLSVWPSHSCTLLKPLGRTKCHLIGEPKVASYYNRQGSRCRTGREGKIWRSNPRVRTLHCNLWPNQHATRGDAAQCQMTLALVNASIFISEATGCFVAHHSAFVWSNMRRSRVLLFS